MKKGLVDIALEGFQTWHTGMCSDEDICWPAFIKGVSMYGKNVVLETFDCRGYNHSIDVSRQEYDVISGVCGEGLQRYVFLLHEFRVVSRMSPEDEKVRYSRKGNFTGLSFSPSSQGDCYAPVLSRSRTEKTRNIN